MFVEAYKRASIFTRPLIISTRTWEGEVESGCGAFVILNKEGWILTVAHILDAQLASNQHLPEIEKYKQEVEKIESDTALSAKQKRKKTNKLNPNRKWITNVSYWWGADGVEMEELKYFYEGDIAIGKIKNYKHQDGFEYPKFKNPKNIQVGKALCKLGYPFHKIPTTFSDEKGFTLEEGSVPLPRFPIDGMYTRNVNCVSETNKTKFPIRFLETSSPGLKGQSGGPTFDVDGNVWAIQSKTINLPLGFSPEVEKNGKKVEEHQFLNVGWGVHPDLIFAFLQEHKVNFEIVD